MSERDLDREIGRALRDDSDGADTLSPGFYTRARSRFEQSRRKRRGLRLVSWESAGLAAAAVIALVLFLPDTVLRSPGTSVQSGLESSKEAGDDEQTAASVPATADGPFAPEPVVVLEQEMREAPEEQAEVVAAAPPAEKKATARRRDQTDRLEAAPSAGVAGEAFRRKVTLGDNRDVELDADFAEAGPAQAKSRSSSAMKKETAAGAVGLPEGTVARSTLRTIEDRAEWERLLLGPAGEAIQSLGDYSSEHRLILIGARGGPSDCSSLTARLVGGAYRISIVETETGFGSWGCALILPRDGREIIVE